MSEARTFVDLALAGEILDPDSKIDDFIEEWHERGGAGTSLHKWLGFERDEYAVFVERPLLLRAILMARRNGLPLEETLSLASGDTTRLAARGVPPEEIPRIRRWLERTGRL
jgi:hypothetical protein